MDSNHIFIETLYEFKRSRRNVIFWMFVVLAVVGIALYVFTPLSALFHVKSINQLLARPPMTWVAQVLSASIPFRCAYLFNILQLFFVVVLVINDTRLSRMDAMMALKVHPQGNTESSIGNIVGKILAFSMVNVLVLLFCALLNLLFYPRVFDIGYYFFYWLTLNLPTLLFCLGLSTLVARLAKSQGVSIILIAFVLGVFTLPGSDWLNGLFDPLAAKIPNMFSDFTGHVNLVGYLWQRGFILFFGVGLAVLSVIRYPRIHNNVRAAFRLTGVALFPLCLASVFAGIYIYDFQSQIGNREAYREVYSRYASPKVLKIVENQLHVKEAKHGGISVTSRMTVENKDVEVLPLVFYLNPGLEVSALTVDGVAVAFRRDRQVLHADVKLSPGEFKEVIVNYEGKIDNSFCFLDIPEEKYTSNTLNTIDIYRVGYAPAFCEKEYKLFTPECAWYPVSVSPYDSLGFRRVMFTRYMLEVEHDPRLVAICQGNANRETTGKTIFTFGHDMKGISLCVGNYKKREIVVGDYESNGAYMDGRKLPPINSPPTRIELFYLPEHEFMLDDYDQYPVDELTNMIGAAKSEIGFDGDNYSERQKNRTTFDLTAQYPYNWVTLVEVPCNFHVFTGKILQVGERVQEGIVFLPEKKYSEKVSLSHATAESRLMEDLDLFYQGSCNLSTICKGNTSFVYSDETPLADHVLRSAFQPSLTWSYLDGKEEFYVVDYMKDHSLKEALRDPLLPRELLDYIIRKKCEEFNALLEVLIGKKEFQEAYHAFLKQHVFEESTFENFSREIFARFNVSLDSMINSWYVNKELPVLEIKGNAISVNANESIFDFKVFNRGKAPGIIRTNGKHPGWIIPPGEGRAIREKIFNPTNNDICTFLSLNVPSNVRLTVEKKHDKIEDIDTTAWCLPLDSTFSFGNRDEIIVDNEDSGFTIHETRKFTIASFFGRVETRAKCYEQVPADHWGLMIRNEYLGFPVRGAYVKQGGKGSQKVQWETDLPEGTYEVFCYQPYDDRSRYMPNLAVREYYYTVFDGKEEHEVVLSMNKDDWEWVSLGVFDFYGKGRVTLSDRDRKQDTSDGNNSPQNVVADAVKWVRVQK